MKLATNISHASEWLVG